VRAALFGLISNYTLLILAQVLGGITSATIGVMTVLVVTDFQAPDMTWRRPLRWLAVAAAVAGAACFLVAMNMARITVLPQTSTSSHKEHLQPKSSSTPS
jgi:hypothetical protein